MSHAETTPVITSVTTDPVPPGDPTAGSAPRRSRRRRFTAPLLVLGGLATLAVLGPLFWWVDPAATGLGPSLAAPSASHPMGTDAVGRDVLARFLGGAGVSLLAALLVTVASGLLGALVGAAAAVSGGVVDTVLSRAADIVLSFPQLVLAMAIAVGLGAGLPGALLAAVLTAAPVTARLVRNDLVRIAAEPYVVAARTLGLGTPHTVRAHLLPQALPTLAVQSAAVFGGTVMVLAALGFVGLGAQVPTPEWGAMIAEGMSASLTGAWWVTVFPGLGLVVAVLGANLLADALTHEPGDSR
ncbi:ABC transporter permease [Pseudonocardia alni]|uniref:ABC transporter permease n=1 Tax=Pseudonocardia alni TaxID=33907 RepID=UPI0033F002A7